jgi:hypothetical protein
LSAKLESVKELATLDLKGWDGWGLAGIMDDCKDGCTGSDDNDSHYERLFPYPQFS